MACRTRMAEDNEHSRPQRQAMLDGIGAMIDLRENEQPARRYRDLQPPRSLPNRMATQPRYDAMIAVVHLKPSSPGTRRPLAPR
jgi:hypothetical protein